MTYEAAKIIRAYCENRAARLQQEYDMAGSDERSHLDLPRIDVYREVADLADCLIADKPRKKAK